MQQPDQSDKGKKDFKSLIHVKINSFLIELYGPNFRAQYNTADSPSALKKQILEIMKLFEFILTLKIDAEPAKANKVTEKFIENIILNKSLLVKSDYHNKSNPTATERGPII